MTTPSGSNIEGSGGGSSSSSSQRRAFGGTRNRNNQLGRGAGNIGNVGVSDTMVLSQPQPRPPVGELPESRSPRHLRRSLHVDIEGMTVSGAKMTAAATSASSSPRTTVRIFRRQPQPQQLQWQEEKDKEKERVQQQRAHKSGPASPAATSPPEVEAAPATAAVVTAVANSLSSPPPTMFVFSAPPRTPPNFQPLVSMTTLSRHHGGGNGESSDFTLQQQQQQQQRRRRQQQQQQQQQQLTPRNMEDDFLGGSWGRDDFIDFKRHHTTGSIPNFVDGDVGGGSIGVRTRTKTIAEEQEGEGEEEEEGETWAGQDWEPLHAPLSTARQTEFLVSDRGQMATINGAKKEYSEEEEEQLWWSSSLRWPAGPSLSALGSLNTQPQVQVEFPTDDIEMIQEASTSAGEAKGEEEARNGGRHAAGLDGTVGGGMGSISPPISRSASAFASRQNSTEIDDLFDPEVPQEVVGNGAEWTDKGGEDRTAAAATSVTTSMGANRGLAPANSLFDLVPSANFAFADEDFMEKQGWRNYTSSSNGGSGSGSESESESESETDAEAISISIAASEGGTPQPPQEETAIAKQILTTIERGETLTKTEMSAPPPPPPAAAASAAAVAAAAAAAMTMTPLPITRGFTFADEEFMANEDWRNYHSDGSDVSEFGAASAAGASGIASTSSLYGASSLNDGGGGHPLGKHGAYNRGGKHGIGRGVAVSAGAGAEAGAGAGAGAGRRKSRASSASARPSSRKARAMVALSVDLGETLGTENGSSSGSDGGGVDGRSSSKNEQMQLHDVAGAGSRHGRASRRRRRLASGPGAVFGGSATSAGASTVVDELAKATAATTSAADALLASRLNGMLVLDPTARESTEPDFGGGGHGQNICLSNSLLDGDTMEGVRISSAHDVAHSTMPPPPSSSSVSSLPSLSSSPAPSSTYKGIDGGSGSGGGGGGGGDGGPNVNYDTGSTTLPPAVLAAAAAAVIDSNLLPGRINSGEGGRLSPPVCIPVLRLPHGNSSSRVGHTGFGKGDNSSLHYDSTSSAATALDSLGGGGGGGSASVSGGEYGQCGLGDLISHSDHSLLPPSSQHNCDNNNNNSNVNSTNVNNINNGCIVNGRYNIGDGASSLALTSCGNAGRGNSMSTYPPRRGVSSSSSLAGPTGTEDRLELVYDPVLNCYFNPDTNQYYELL
eukprot:UC1_evm2s1108